MITIKKLGEILKENLPINVFNIKGEVSKPSISNGHMYLTLKDESSMISSIIWRSKVTEDILKLKNGDMIEVKGTVDYYVPRGEIKLIISNVKKLDNTGDMHAMFEQLKNEFDKKGYFLKKLNIPTIIKKIAIITSLKGAAIHDFMYALENNKSLVECIKIDTIVQGSECPKQIIECINKNDFSDIDLIIITRGGGSMEDLWGFNDKNLIQTVFNRTTPILSAIGHMVDTTLLDYVADISAPTPSLAAQFIVDHNKKYIDSINNIKIKIYNNVISDINKKLSMLEKYNNIKNDIQSEFKNKLETFKYNIKNDIKNQLNRLEIIKINHTNNISLYISNKNNDKILSYESFSDIVKEKLPFTLVWNNIIININNYN